MNIKIVVIIIFCLSSIYTIISILIKPSISIGKKVKLQTFYFGSLLGAVFFIFFGFISPEEVLINLIGNSRLSPIGILILFFSMAFISIFLDYCGFFDYCARLSIKHAGNSGRKLFFLLYFLISFLTIFTSNDIIILTFTPFIYYFTKDSHIDPTPYLVAEFFAANTWSMMLYVGNPTNILLAGAFDITFFDYFKVMFLPTIVAGVINISVIYLIFRKKINAKIIKPENKVEIVLKDKYGSITGLVILILCIITLSISQYIHIEMWKISFFFALLLLVFIIVRMSYNYYISIRNSSKFKNPILVHSVKRMPWVIIPFVLSLFIIVAVVDKYGICSDIYIILNKITENNIIKPVYLYGVSSVLFTNILNNIPMSVLFVSILKNISGNSILQGVYATIIGSNLGANFTPIGALAGIMWITILKNHGIKFSFFDFIKYGSLVTFFTIFGTLTVLYFIFF